MKTAKLTTVFLQIKPSPARLPCVVVRCATRRAFVQHAPIIDNLTPSLMAASSTNSTIVIVHKNEQTFYFGSVSAVFEVFSRDDIGASLRYLHNCGLPYSNPKTAVRIERAKLVRKAAKNLKNK